MNLLKKIPFYVLVFYAISCSPKTSVSKVNYQFKSSTGKADYSNLDYWAAHPWKWDPSDSIPKPLRKNYVKDSTTDVFFIHPTSFTDFADSSWNAMIDDSSINKKTDNTSILYQASVFNEQSRVFAPRYRQAHLRAFYSHDTQKRDSAFQFSYEDVRTAFEYFLEHFNNGRPIIIAAHSQGSLHAEKLLKDYFENKVLQNRLVCAYLVGMPVPENYFTSLFPCKDSLSTGCYVSWRTFKKDYTDTIFISKEKVRSIVTNPLNWTSSTEYVPRNFNTGAVLANFNKIKKHTVDAQVHENVLWTCKPRFFGNIFFTTKNYHIADINLFYMNIRDNVRTRIKMFWKR